MVWGVIIRILLLAYFFMMIHIGTEVFGSFVKTIIVPFFVLSIIVAGLLISFFIFIPIHYFKYKRTPEVFSNSRVQPLYSGIRTNWTIRGLYHVGFISRRIFITILILTSPSLSPLLKLIPLIILHSSSFLNSIIIRPHINRVDRMIALLNDTVLIILSFSLAVGNWPLSITTAILIIFPLNTAIVTVVILVNIAVKTLKKCRSKKPQEKKTSWVKPINSSRSLEVFN